MKDKEKERKEPPIVVQKNKLLIELLTQLKIKEGIPLDEPYHNKILPGPDKRKKQTKEPDEEDI